MSTSRYQPVDPVVRDLVDFVHRSSDRVKEFESAVESACDPKNGGDKEMKQEGIQTLDDYFKFVDHLVRWVPQVSSTGDEVLNKILVFYWVLDQPTLAPYQTKIHPTTANTDLTWLSYWLVTFAREQGKWLDTADSAGSVYTFYRNSKYNKEADAWEEPVDGWKSFNHWFGRHWKDINKTRPVASPTDDNVIVSGADSMFDGHWDIVNGNIDFKDTLIVKGVEWPVSTLLRSTGIDYNNGSFMHAFLSPTDYHRQHAPVSGKVIEVRNIQDQVYLQVSKKAEGPGIGGSRGLVRAPADIHHRKKHHRNEFYDLDAPDEAGYQWCQTRGLIVIQTPNHGKVAVLPIGMAQVSSVKMTVKEGDEVKKGDNISYFQFGGSDICLVFEKRVKWREDLKVGETKLNVREKLATFD
ncbi:phosphatidylserine decarboxylase [Aspergillus clavatus NRRL 1]|uniref:Phosphatidylserine decarboxylase, putative n=1 Tax=Aspergillus clavatus (strain ATCC 1007 / CBS 513.65 / DSM 816 / NCTC 3887 / NRRL 1 / QM 1276 / 107) TaxID=344612 RepID=A1CN70_ASPCL|nr:phosphatidylserine decarboxylase, putative [Aspergillus clavatus NRRL 1]EAW07091.1 phosphatidylserine decarboxylase, putative [Aspergillus clavatus NRRL 1]